MPLTLQSGALAVGGRVASQKQTVVVERDQLLLFMGKYLQSKMYMLVAILTASPLRLVFKASTQSNYITVKLSYKSGLQ